MYFLRDGPGDDSELNYRGYNLHMPLTKFSKYLLAVVTSIFWSYVRVPIAYSVHLANIHSVLLFCYVCLWWWKERGLKSTIKIERSEGGSVFSAAEDWLCPTACAHREGWRTIAHLLGLLKYPPISLKKGYIQDVSTGPASGKYPSSWDYYANSCKCTAFKIISLSDTSSWSAPYYLWSARRVA